MLTPLLFKVCRLQNGELTILDEEKFRKTTAPALADFAAFATDEKVRITARYLLRAAARKLGAYPASIDPLYSWVAHRGHLGFTVPAFNLRGLPFDSACAIFSEMQASNVGPVIFEIARSEMMYCDLPPEEFAPMIFAAAIHKNYRGPIFLQADHVQVHRDLFQKSETREQELSHIEELIERAIANDFLNIDIDASTLVDLSLSTIIEQQRDNILITARLAKFIRDHEPRGIAISIGAEVGEIGKTNTTEEELRTFIQGFREIFDSHTRGLSKVSIQTGSTHGGKINPDGSYETLRIDVDLHRLLSPIARVFGLAGTVQHGASTLPDDLFALFPKNDCVEIHLATGLQNLILQSPAVPKDFLEAISEEQRALLQDEWKPGWTQDQFYAKTVKKTWGAFKNAWWHVDHEVRKQIRTSIQEKVRFYFDALEVEQTREMILDHVPEIPVPLKKPDDLLDV